ncbi:helix-turn-helix domain-containing protein [Methylobacterium komagatae]
MSLAVIFGANLRHHRKGRHLTQAGLAERVGLSTEMISKMERGIAAPSMVTIERLADILDVPAVAFFGVGTVLTHDSERSRLLGKVHTRLSRLNEAQLARANRMLAALTD